MFNFSYNVFAFSSTVSVIQIWKSGIAKLQGM